MLLVIDLANCTQSKALSTAITMLLSMHRQATCGVSIRIVLEDPARSQLSNQTSLTASITKNITNRLLDTNAKRLRANEPLVDQLGEEKMEKNQTRNHPPQHRKLRRLRP